MRTMNKILATGLGLLTLGALPGADLMAQDPAAQNSSKARSQTNADPVVSLEFAGGSLAKFAAALRKAGDDVNIVMPALAAEVDLPALALSQTTVESALKSIDAVIGDDFRIRVKTLRSQVGKPVYAVSVHLLRSQRKVSGASTQVAGANNSATSVDVLSLKFLTSTVPGDVETSGQTMKAETILTAVDTGLGIHPGVTKPEFRYHEDSGLLFINGLSRDLGLVRAIIQNLEIDVRRLREANKMQAARKQAEDRQAAKEARNSETGK